MLAKSYNQNRQSREVVLNTLLLGTLGLAVLAFLIVLSNFLFLGRDYVAPRLFIMGLGMAVIWLLFRLPKRYYLVAAYSLISLYLVSATAVVYLWGFNAPFGILLFALVVVLSGILLGAHYSIYVLLLITAILSVLAYANLKGLVHPDLSWTTKPSNFSDVIGFAIMLGILALVSWLFNRGMEQSLLRAEKSEEALKRQKSQLAVKVERRTRQFQLAQVEKMKQLYRFAELGHITTALFHDLASRLSALSLDVDSLGSSRQNRADLIKQTHESIDYIDDMVRQVRIQIQGQTPPKYFKLLDELSEVAQTLNYKAVKQKVKIEQRVNIPPKTSYFGDPIGFRQMISNILGNSIDSYSGVRAGKTRRGVVTILIDKTASDIIITFSDQGRGINKNDQAKIFEPFFTTKKQGMGIGLFISKQLAEKQFKGKLLVTSTVGKGTTFTLLLPKTKRKKG